MDYKKMKKGGSLFLVVNIVLAIFAFAFIFGASTPTVVAEIESDALDAGAMEKATLDELGDLDVPGSTLASGKKVPPEPSTFMEKWFTGEATGEPGEFGTGGTAGIYTRAIGWAAIAYFVAPMISDLLGLEDGEAEAFQAGLTAGVFAGKLVAGLQTSGTLGAETFFGKVNPFATGLVIGIIVFILLYSKEEVEYVEFECLPWEAPIGGGNCEACNDGIHPCSEYRCRSLGQACEIVNAGSENELCVWVNPHDVNSALITPWEDVLTDSYSYSRTISRPPSWGTEIVPSEDPAGCIQAFSPLEFGIQTNKPTQCKVDFIIKNTYDEMEYYFGENNLFSYNHSQGMNVPNAKALIDLAIAEGQEIPEGLDIENANDYNLYVRCSTANGYYNVDPYVIRFCVDDGPDATPPYIAETSIRNNQPVQFEVNTVPIEVYTNELTNCKWSHDDKGFNDMENEMSCVDRITDLNSDLFYTCTGELTGLKDREANDYYFKCEDQPSLPKDQRNVMTQSYVLNLLGTEPLNIKEGSVRPITGSTVEGSTTRVEVTLGVTTEDGFENGKASCFYSIGEGNTNYVAFFETDSHIHKQRQDLPEGTYTYNYRCLDAGGNSADATTTFDM